MWYLTFIKNQTTEVFIDLWRKGIRDPYHGVREATAVTDDLRRYYKMSNMMNPQLEVSVYTNYVTVSMLSTTSLVVMLEAFFWTFSFKHKPSNCRWSIWPVVLAQSLTILLSIIVIINWCLFLTIQKRNTPEIWEPLILMNIWGFKVFTEVLLNRKVEDLLICHGIGHATRLFQVLVDFVIHLMFVRQFLMTMINKVSVFVFWLTVKAVQLILKYFELETSAPSFYSNVDIRMSDDLSARRWVDACRHDHPNQLLRFLQQNQPSPESLDPLKSQVTLEKVIFVSYLYSLEIFIKFLCLLTRIVSIWFMFLMKLLTSFISLTKEGFL